VVRVDVVLAVITELRKCITLVVLVDVDKVTRRPHLHTDQHKVDILWMIQL